MNQTEDSDDEFKASPGTAKMIERMREIDEESRSLVVRMKLLKIESDGRIAREYMDQQSVVEMGYIRAKIELRNRELVSVHSTSYCERKLSEDPHGDVNELELDGDVPSSPQLSPMAKVSEVSSPQDPQYVKVPSPKTEVGSWSSVLTDHEELEVGVGICSSSGCMSSAITDYFWDGLDSEENKTGVLKAKKERRAKAKDFDEKDIVKMDDMVWVGMSRSIFHSVQCTHYEASLKSGLVDMMTVASALEKGLRLPVKRGGCCRKYFAPE